MEAKQQMIHISSDVAREKLPGAEIATNLSKPWPELLLPLPRLMGPEAAWL